MLFAKSRIPGIFAACVGLVAVAGAAAWAISGAAVEDIDPATLHPAESVLYAAWDGADLHADAIQRTAQYEALVESGLLDYGSKLISQNLPLLSQQLGPRSGGREVAQLGEAKVYLKALYDQGFSFSVSAGKADGPPIPLATLVLHNMAGRETQITRLTEMIDRNAEPQTETIAGRVVSTLPISDLPGFELSWFSEANHLVVSFGPGCAQQVIETADGNSPNVTTNANWDKYHETKTDFEVASVSWFDFGSLRDRFGEMPVPVRGAEVASTVNDFVDALGLQNLNTIAGQFGYRDRACIARTHVEAPGERTGLLALMDQPLFSLEDLPPAPAKASTIAAFSLDLAKSWDIGLATIRDTLKLLPPEASDEFEQALAQLPQFLGLDLRDDLFAPMGTLHCIYADPAGGPFGLGFGANFSVRDSEKLNATVSRLLGSLQQALQRERLPMPMKIQRKQMAEREIITVPAGMFAPSLGIDRQWAAFSLYPQSVKTFFMRLDGDLPKWEPTAEHKQAFAELPQEFTAISIDDPRGTLEAVYGFIPMLNSTAHTFIPEARGRDVLSAADLPPQEVVAAPLFPNVSVSGPGKDGFDFHSRQSMPIMPMPSVQSGAAIPVLVALLLPAVQQAREAARRTQSKNNLKQFGLAMHNYHDVYNHFPHGTVQDTDLKPEQRLSFFYSILPFYDQAALYNAISPSVKSAWDDDAVKDLTSSNVPTCLHPGMASVIPGATHYVGMAGIGEDAPELAVGHERAGIFGYDRKTGIRDITDGTSNTIMMTETSDTDIPWAAGGRTLKSLTQERYINGPDGIGGPSPGGCNVLFADGSVRFISENIDAETMRRLAAMADGKAVNGF